MQGGAKPPSDRLGGAGERGQLEERSAVEKVPVEAVRLASRSEPATTPLALDSLLHKGLKQVLRTIQKFIGTLFRCAVV